MIFKIHYFKPSGKWYTSGEFEDTSAAHMQDVVDHLKEFFAAGHAPGLSGWHGSFHVVILPPENCPFGYPCMIPLK